MESAWAKTPFLRLSNAQASRTMGRLAIPIVSYPESTSTGVFARIDWSSTHSLAKRACIAPSPTVCATHNTSTWREPVSVYAGCERKRCGRKSERRVAIPTGYAGVDSALTTGVFTRIDWSSTHSLAQRAYIAPLPTDCATHNTSTWRKPVSVNEGRERKCCGRTCDRTASRSRPVVPSID